MIAKIIDIIKFVLVSKFILSIIVFPLFILYLTVYTFLLLFKPIKVMEITPQYGKYMDFPYLQKNILSLNKDISNMAFNLIYTLLKTKDFKKLVITVSIFLALLIVNYYVYIFTGLIIIQYLYVYRYLKNNGNVTFYALFINKSDTLFKKIKNNKIIIFNGSIILNPKDLIKEAVKGVVLKTTPSIKGVVKYVVPLNKGTNLNNLNNNTDYKSNTSIKLSNQFFQKNNKIIKDFKEVSNKNLNEGSEKTDTDYI